MAKNLEKKIVVRPSEKRKFNLPKRVRISDVGRGKKYPMCESGKKFLIEILDLKGKKTVVIDRETLRTIVDLGSYTADDIAEVLLSLPGRQAYIDATAKIVDKNDKKWKKLHDSGAILLANKCEVDLDHKLIDILLDRRERGCRE